MDTADRKINFEDAVGKTVGRRRAPLSADASSGLQETGGRLFQRWVKGLPRGVYRYHSHEEADRHLMSVYTRET